MSHNTMRRKLCRTYNISPREARIVLRAHGYNYELAEASLINIGLHACILNNMDLVKALNQFSETCIKVANAVCAGINAFGEAFRNTLAEEPEIKHCAPPEQKPINWGNIE